MKNSEYETDSRAKNEPKKLPNQPTKGEFYLTKTYTRQLLKFLG
jgi:hypothetical protein